MELIMLGTGNASVLNCYNSCFLLKDDNNLILVDGGGGSGIFNQLDKVGINWKQIQNIIVTHKHMDHLIGVLWIVRMFCQHTNRNEHEGTLNIYSHNEVIFLIRDFIEKFLEKKDLQLLNKSLFLIEVKDGESRNIFNKEVTFFDVCSNKAKQYGFKINYEENKNLTCCGDEPYNKINEKHVKNSDWLIHEAFCLKSEEKLFKAYEKNHSTVADACRVAEELGIKNLVLYHTEDKNIKNRKELYLSEGKKIFKGNLYVPYDLEEISI
ncbi:MBL fold metallo-hydrolase [Methanosphaera sp. ISO3-F5]|uniref:MBL fold metallo-hydrolase n=1 Tax=Methanosphaera sp. ISO3-F5 TaxID=1452353 RepID=UPI002B261FD9|nr:MBL fold metallo-hydrolase [Methanosphaera sp. ISO3-F5]WQH64198.1 MBL fold metallo-hydrolase [Methanosphaera sp. ISO3-F5]